MANGNENGNGNGYGRSLVIPITVVVVIIGGAFSLASLIYKEVDQTRTMMIAFQTSDQQARENLRKEIAQERLDTRREMIAYTQEVERRIYERMSEYLAAVREIRESVSGIQEHLRQVETTSPTTMQMIRSMLRRLENVEKKLKELEESLEERQKTETGRKVIDTPT